jgi:hypothetical protein
VAIQVSWDGFISVSGTDLSDHCVQILLNDGQESRDVTAFGDTSRRFRAGLGLASIEATFLNDLSTGSIENTLRTHLLFQNEPGTKTPASAPTAALSGSTGNLIAGAYRYWLTYTFPAFETAPSTYASVTVVSATSGEVALTAIPASTEWFVTGKNLYRSIAGGGSTTGVLLASIANSATSYLDNASSSSLVGNAALNFMWQPSAFDVIVKKHDTATSTDNPAWTLEALITDDLNVQDEKPGEVSQMKVKFTKHGAFSVATA